MMNPITTAMAFCCLIQTTSGFGPPPHHHSIPSIQTNPSNTAQTVAPSLTAHENSMNNRRLLLQSLTTAILGTTSSQPAYAATTTAQEVTFKPIIDDLFSIEVPQTFFAIRRTNKGDLPDAKTGKGRRGGTIFTAGDMGKAEVVAVERFPTQVLLEEEGILPTGDLSTFTSIGEPSSVASLLLRRREKDKPGTVNTAILDRDSVSTSSDGKLLTFTTRQQINVNKPELLMEQMGVSELYRTTLAKASLESGDGNIMVVYASALDVDFNNGVDGEALRRVVDSFRVVNQGGLS